MMHEQSKPEKRVAIVGGGPSGIVVARYLKQHGLQPVIFEQSDSIGGQWNARSNHSGVWPWMRANTSRVLTCFSDLDHEPGTTVYPHNQEMLAYLHRYAGLFGLTADTRLRSLVELVDRDASSDGWNVGWMSAAGKRRTERFAYVIIASGRYNEPRIPPLPGISSFSGSAGVSHTFQYKSCSDRYRDRRVLVAGSSISAHEIASDLAMVGAERVISSSRRQRYIIPKLLGGIPAEHVLCTRFAALAAEIMSLDQVARGFKELILRFYGSPEQYGALRPANDILEAGISLSQYFLPLVAEGRIVPKPWISAIEGQTVHFADGSVESIDAIVFGTGFDLHLPFLSEGIRQTLSVDADHIDLYEFTFHPELPGLAFLGMFPLQGPYFPVLELQARWIAYVWSGTRQAPSRPAMEAGVAAYRAQRGAPQDRLMHPMALLFAREAGVEPDPWNWPDLARALLFGPLSAVSFRLSGADKLPDAAERSAASARAFGAVPSAEFTTEQRAQLEILGSAGRRAPGL
jgi:thioredoxin reductase